MLLGISNADEIVEQDYNDTVDENSYLSEVYKKHSTARAFLSRSEKIYTRSLKLDSSAASVWLNYNTDIDGCVVELNDLTGIKLPIRHITICPNDLVSLKEVKSVLKKHVNLTEYSKDALGNFTNSVGIQLFYENGWECWLGIIPDAGVRSVKLNRDVIRIKTADVFKQIRFELRRKLAEYAKEGVALRTIMKNDLDDLRKIFVLPDDRCSVLAALQSATSCVNMKYHRLITFCFRFGEKTSGGVSLSEFQSGTIEKVTVHAAIDISSSVPGIDLLWSMDGLQQVVGLRGTLSTCLSFTDCGNFQTNLDGKAVDIKPELRRVCLHPEKLMFVQLYADVPHLRPKTRLHPVSGTIAGGHCFHRNTADAFGRDAEKYLSAMHHNFSLLLKSTCRLEVVVELSEISEKIEAEDCIDVNKVDSLLQQKPMLVPIPSASLHCIQAIGIWFSKELKELLASYEKSGNVNAIWQSYQYELACEKLLWGRPFCNQSFPYSVNLGPGVLDTSRSLTDQLGFIALESHTACMAFDNSIPPCRIWTSSDGIGKSIARAAGVHDHLDASYPVVGRLLVLALVKDLYETGEVGIYVRFEEFLSALKASETRFQIVGAITAVALVDLLSMKRRSAVYTVFGNLCQMIVNHRLPLKDIIDAGIVDLGLHLFPAVETYDTHGHAVLRWNLKRNFWKVVRSSDSSTTQTQLSAEVYTQLTKGELEQRGIIFPSKLKKLPAVWPWIGPCLCKLVQENLSNDATVTTLAFLSTLAFIMLGWFVDFDRFASLFQVLPVKQFRLKTLEIQSKLELPKFKFHHLRIFRLHWSIPHQLKIVEKEAQSASAEERKSEPETEHVLPDETVGNRIRGDYIVESVNKVERREVTCRSVGVVKNVWNAKEMEILDQLSSERAGKSMKELYHAFRTKCMTEGIPFRTFMAFRLKFIRMR